MIEIAVDGLNVTDVIAVIAVVLSNVQSHPMSMRQTAMRVQCLLPTFLSKRVNVKYTSSSFKRAKFVMYPHLIPLSLHLFLFFMFMQ
jgi:hypothetical protein